MYDEIVTPEQWVGLACGPHRVLDWTNYIIVSGGVAHGTDAKRFHWSPSSLPDGLYDPATLTPASAVCHVGNLEIVKNIITETVRSIYSDKMVVAFEGRENLEYVHAPNGGPAIKKRYFDEAVLDDTTTLFYTNPPNVKFYGINARFPDAQFVIHSLSLNN